MSASSFPASESIRVGVRVRPIFDAAPMSWELDQQRHCLKYFQNGRQTASEYQFDYLYGENSQTQDIYSDLMSDAVTGAVKNGINASVFAYGQTGSGKTYTMLGATTQPGIVSLAIKDIFTTIGRCPDREFLLRISYVEIYNEFINDLLSTGRNNDNITIATDGTLEHVTEAVVLSMDDVFTLIAAGEAERQVGRTDWNEVSSRSHTVFCMKIESRLSRSNGGIVMKSEVNLVDLAGSENLSTDSNVDGSRRTETRYINQSLLALSRVILKLNEANESGGRYQVHIPYRDSKLTRLLQNSLGGQSRSVIVCTVTPSVRCAAETHNTLRFASNARHIRNAVKPNIYIPRSEPLIIPTSSTPVQVSADNNDSLLKLQKQLQEQLKDQAKMKDDMLMQQQELTNKYEALLDEMRLKLSSARKRLQVKDDEINVLQQAKNGNDIDINRLIESESKKEQEIQRLLQREQELQEEINKLKNELETSRIPKEVPLLHDDSKRLEEQIARLKNMIINTPCKDTTGTANALLLSDDSQRRAFDDIMVHLMKLNGSMPAPDWRDHALNVVNSRLRDLREELRTSHVREIGLMHRVDSLNNRVPLTTEHLEENVENSELAVSMRSEQQALENENESLRDQVNSLSSRLETVMEQQMDPAVLAHLNFAAAASNMPVQPVFPETTDAVVSLALSNGMRVLKHNRSGKPHPIILSISKDRLNITWKPVNILAAVGATSERQLALNDITRLVYGQETRVFKRQSESKPEEIRLSLSLITEQRSLDIVLPDEVSFGLWQSGLEKLLGFKGQYSATYPHYF